MSRITDLLLRIPFPDTCIVCGKVVGDKRYACEKCIDKIEYITPSLKCRTCLGFLYRAENGICGSCIAEKPAYTRLISCIKYKGPVRDTIRAYKFRNRPDFHIGYSRLACEVLEREGEYFDAVVCTPLHKNSLKERGYNQSALIAKRIAEYFQVPFFEDLLIKTKHTKRQSELKLAERKKNIKNAFKVHKPKRIKGLKILLVDDIYTTGCTMKEVAKTCVPYADEIIAFTLAKSYFEY